MKLAVSNIAWASENDLPVYGLMKKYGYSGLEIAPTRIFPEEPYRKLREAGVWRKDLKEKYGFDLPSMQSIWYGRQENLFGGSEERERLMDYTKQAVDFAAVLGCKNLVFGCPKNRNLLEGADAGTAVDFFREAGDYAASKGTAIGMEANPPVYHTNFINDTESAFRLVRKVGSDGFLLNLDVGTMIYNNEALSVLQGNIKYISHVHISEPGLQPIETRELHKSLFDILRKEGYKGYISIEMGRMEDLSVIEEKLRYIGGIFAGA